MFKKRIRCATIVLISILSLSIVFVVFFGVTLRRNKGSETMTVLVGDASYVEGIEISLFEEDVSEVHWLSGYPDEVCQCYTEYRNTYKMQFDGTVASINVSCDKAEGDWRTYTTKLFCDPEIAPKYRYREGYQEIHGNDLPGSLYVYTHDKDSFFYRTSYVMDDYVTFADEDKFLYYYREGASKTYEAFSLKAEEEEIEKNVCFLNGTEYLFLWSEPTYEYYCTYKNYADSDGSSASMETRQWGFEEAYENIPDKSYVSKLKEFGMPEITMNVKKGIYCHTDEWFGYGTLDCILPMSDIAEEFDFLWMASVETENALSVIGRRGNALVEIRYFVETGTVTEQVLWEADEELAEWFEAAERVTNIDVMEDGGRTYLCYSKEIYEPAEDESSYVGGDMVRLVVFEQGNRVFEGEIRLQKELFEVLQDFSFNTNEVHDRDQRMCGIEICKK